MPELTTAPASIDPKQVAANLTKGITDRANGKSPSKGPGEAEGADKAPAPVDPNAGKRKFVVEGKEVYLTPEQADAYVQKGLAFEPKMSEMARMRQEMAQLEQTLVQNPGAIIANIAKKRNIPIQQLVENVLSSNASDEVKEATGKWYWENVAKRHQMDPKDREILEKDERIKVLEDADKQKAEAAIAIENRNKMVAALGQVSGQIQETLKELGIKDVNGPTAIRLTKEIADVMRISYFSRQPCTAKQAADKVRERILNYQKQFYDDLDPDRLVEALGKENAEKVRKHFLKVVQAAENGTQQEKRSSGQPTRRDERKTIGMDDFHDYLDELKRTSK